MSSRLLVLLENVECKPKDGEQIERAAPTALDYYPSTDPARGGVS
jgi:hypothetical protein